FNSKINGSVSFVALSITISNIGGSSGYCFAFSVITTVHGPADLIPSNSFNCSDNSYVPTPKSVNIKSSGTVTFLSYSTFSIGSSVSTSSKRKLGVNPSGSSLPSNVLSMVNFVVKTSTL